MFKTIFTSIFFLGISLSVFSQKTYKTICVGFYNLENLFDTEVDPDTAKILQDDFTPDGPHAFTEERYQKKLENLTMVISKMGIETTPDGPAILGVSEIENKKVLEDLVKMPAIADRNYQIVHYESPDRRGIDVALLYQEKYFDLESSRSFRLTMEKKPDFKTRDQLLVSGVLDGEKFHFLVAHWPSRRGGEKRSRPNRVAAAELGKSIIDSLQKHDPDSKIVYMGDLNDDPVDVSMKTGMKSVGTTTQMISDKIMYNPMEDLYRTGIGTLAWRDSWNLFDQMLVNKNLVATEKDYDSYKLYKAVVFNEEFLKVKEGRFKGYPKRCYVGTTWQGGYSDHFPVYLYLIKEN